MNSRKNNILLLLFVLAVTFGDTNGTIILTAFFLVVSVIGKEKTKIVYALIPIAYLIISAYSYTSMLINYGTFAFDAFIAFFRSILSGNVSPTVVPWEKVSARTTQDIYVVSAAYLSFLILAFSIIVLSVFLWIKTNNLKTKNKVEFINRSGIICLMIFLCVAVMTYIGAAGPEQTFSDIRTITIVLLSLMTPFLLMEKTKFEHFTSNGILAILITGLIVVASLRTLYEVYPKSMLDPINVAEDNRLGSSGIYIILSFLDKYYQTGGIVADYKTLNRLGPWLNEAQYSTRLLNKTTMTAPFALYPYKSIIIFNSAGLSYPSLYIPSDTYNAVENFSFTNNRIYDNGIVVITVRVAPP